MKKSIFVLLCVLISAVCLTLVGCSPSLGRYNKYVSEYRDEVLVGSSKNFSAQAVSGFREAPFTIDGVSGEKCDFCVVTITPANFDPTLEYKYKVTIDGKDYEGDLVKHPFENTYSFEVNNRCGSSLTVYINDEEINLTSVKNENFVSAEKAFEIALKRLSSTEIVKDGKYEIYIRLIENPISASGGYFWYVAFVDTDKDTCAALIAPESMEIIAVRE